jgi:hypothetical protein
MKLRQTRDTAVISRMADTLTSYDAARNSSDAIRCLVGRFAPIDVALFTDEARKLALKPDVGLEAPLARPRPDITVR